ncbi:hypothetical protein KFL_006360030 [Klebsormidium nitens]|uniref:Uncharacterized protein n=1 Tax=Klebsormidium nitens TaxID=105231 RepID=A0A1Y1IMN8_KLENI|nr:hypothetical protein KFL_006360030 [Klebsormidium nitens]|eukprot:GAQ90411.1 hypothetical protein KFL_006360030 [Klebsormidium nitens]
MMEVEDTSLGFTNRLLNVVAPVTIFVTVAVTSPVLLVWRGVKQLANRPLDMRDKVVVVTGASSGIGMHISYQYAGLGSRLALVARREEKLDAVAEECRRRGAPDVLTVPADLGTQDGCREAVEQAAKHYGRLDCVVLNAGVAHIYKFEEVQETEGFRSIMDVNFWGYVFCAKYALKHLRQTGGQLVVNDSIAEFVPEPNLSIYNASKAAVSQFFETLRLEAGPGIPITIFQPGVVKSEMTDGKVILADGRWSSAEEGRELRKEPGFGLFPVLPTPALAKAAVAAARRKTMRAVIPSWYKSMLFLRLFSPELFMASLSWLFRGDRTPAKAAQDKMGGGFKAPSDADMREGGYRKSEE